MYDRVVCLKQATCHIDSGLTIYIYILSKYCNLKFKARERTQNAHMHYEVYAAAGNSVTAEAH